MTQEAIQTDVSEDKSNESQAPPKPTKSMGDMARDAIFEKRAAAKQQQQDIEEKKIELPEGHDSQEMGGKEVQTIAFLDESGQVINVPITARFRAKIDGVDEDVPVETITRSYQKGVAADRRLEESTRKMKAAEDKAAEIAAREAGLTAKEKEFAAKMESASRMKDEGALSDDGYKQVAEGLIDALTKSETPVDDIAKVLRGIAPKQVETIDREALLREAEQRIETKMSEKERARAQEAAKKQRETANDWFRTEFKDIVEDPMTMGAAKEYAALQWSENPTAEPKEIAQKVGAHVRKWKESLSSTGRKTPLPTPKAATSRALLGKDEEKPLTRKEIINQMRATRGQPPL